MPFALVLLSVLGKNQFVNDFIYFPIQVLRFSRLFKPGHVPHIWKKKKKKKEDEGKDTKTDIKVESKTKEPGICEMA